MTSIEYDIKAIQQKTSECMQTSATQLLSFFDPTVKLEDVIKAVPLYIENGEKIGTSPGHLAAYFAQQGYKTTVYVFDVELFDRSWNDLSAPDVINKLKKRAEYIPTNSWLTAYKNILIDGWELFVKSGGGFIFPILSVGLLQKLLTKAPYLLMVNSTYLNHQAKSSYDKSSDKMIPDSLKGHSTTHAVICAGYRDDKFLIVDPDPPKGTNHHRWIEQDHLIASIMSAQTESDNLLIAIEQ